MKLFDYQQEAIRSKKNNTVICNWARGLGATYTLAQKILRQMPESVVYVSGNGSSGFEDLQGKIDEILGVNGIEYQFDINSCNKEYVKLKRFGKKTEIYSLRTASSLYSNLEYDLILFDGMLPFNTGLKAKQVISMVTINNHDRVLQKLNRLDRMVKILECDYKKGVLYNLIPAKHMEQLKVDDVKTFYREYAILDNPNLTKKLSEEVDVCEKSLEDLVTQGIRSAMSNAKKEWSAKHTSIYTECIGALLKYIETLGKVDRGSMDYKVLDEVNDFVNDEIGKLYSALEDGDVTDYDLMRIVDYLSKVKVIINRPSK